MKGEKLKEILKNSVKVNRIFFRTPDLRAFEAFRESHEIKEYCWNVLNEITDFLKPSIILAEHLEHLELSAVKEKILY